jgi:hypothetical protein
MASRASVSQNITGQCQFFPLPEGLQIGRVTDLGASDLDDRERSSSVTSISPRSGHRFEDQAVPDATLCLLAEVGDEASSLRPVARK